MAWTLGTILRENHSIAANTYFWLQLRVCEQLPRIRTVMVRHSSRVFSKTFGTTSLSLTAGQGLLGPWLPSPWS